MLLRVCAHHSPERLPRAEACTALVTSLPVAICSSTTKETSHKICPNVLLLLPPQESLSPCTPKTSFMQKNGLRDFPLWGRSLFCAQAIKKFPFLKLFISCGTGCGREIHFQGKFSRTEFAQLSLGVKILHQQMFRASYTRARNN